MLQIKYYAQNYAGIIWQTLSVSLLGYRNVSEEQQFIGIT